MNLDLDGVADVQASIDNLKDRFGDNPVWAVGTNTEYGLILELGRGPIQADSADALKFEVDGQTVFAQSVSGHPPYPWFRPAIREFERDAEGFIRDTTGYDSIQAIPSTEALVEAVATGLSNRMTDNVSAGTSGDRSPGTHPQHPKRDTGNLAASISAIRIQ